MSRAGPLAVIVGDVINDVVVRVSGPVAAGSDTPASIEPRPGGSGANLAAWMGSLGARVRFVGRAGLADAETHRRSLAAWGVDARISEDPSAPTGTIVVLVGPDGERSMLTDRGASARLGPDDLDPAILADASLLHLSGYALFGPATREPALALWAAAAAAGLSRSIDPSSVTGLREVGAGAFLDWSKGATLAFPNLDEGRALTGREEPEDIVRSLLPYYDTVALKLGAHGTLVGDSSGRRIRAQRPPAGTIESTGAGDAYCAGYLAACLAAQPMSVAVEAALDAAARAIATLGGRPTTISA